MWRNQRGGSGVREGVTEADSQGGSAPEPRGLSLPGISGGGHAEKTGWPWVCTKYLALRARLLPGGRLGSDCSLGWDFWVREGPAGLSLGSVRFKSSSEATASRQGQAGLASHRWAVCPAGMTGLCGRRLPSQPRSSSGGGEAAELRS